MFKKNFFLLLTLVFFQTLYADKNNSAQEHAASKEKKALSPDKCILPSARPCIYSCEDSRGALFSEITFLYMQTKVANMPIALIKQTGDFQTKVIYPDFDFEAGFKLLAGGYIPRLNWETSICWTQIYSKNSKDLSSDEHKFLPVFYDQEFNSDYSSSFTTGHPRFLDVSAEHKIYFNSVHWDLAKSIWLSPRLIMKLHGGIEGDFIKQIFKVDYSNGNTSSQSTYSSRLFHDYEKLINTSKGAGIRIGFDSKWQLFSSELFLLASPSASFILSSFDTRHYIDNRQTFSILSIPNNEYYYQDKIKEHIWVVRPNAEMILGLKYGRCFSSCYFSFKTAYEVRYFWEQNLNRPSHIQRSSYPVKGDLFLHGLNCSVRLEF